ncbi:MAG: phosphotransferase family protein, partial [Steroidobacteraceae bacterium]
HAGRSHIPDWTFVLAFSCFRMAAITQGVYARGLQGNAADPRALQYGEHAREFAATGLGIVARGVRE